MLVAVFILVCLQRGRGGRRLHLATLADLAAKGKGPFFLAITGGTLNFPLMLIFCVNSNLLVIKTYINPEIGPSACAQALRPSWPWMPWRSPSL